MDPSWKDSIHRFRFLSLSHLALAGALLSFSGCGDDGVSVDPPPDYEGLDPARAPASRMLDVPQRVRVAGYCYIESLTMQIAHYRPDISRGKVFAYAMIGAGIYWGDGPGGALCTNHMFTNGHQMALLENFGVPYVLGSGSEGGFGGEEVAAGAAGLLRFSGAQEAFGYLRAAVGSGRPVTVHLDLHYLRDGEESAHPLFHDSPPQASHWMLVTGYDEDYVYLTETIAAEDDPVVNILRNFPVPIASFLESWERAEDICAGTDLQAGPFYMLMFDLPEGGSFTEARTEAEIVAAHKARAEGNEETILSHLDDLVKNDGNDWSYRTIGFVRTVWSEFLAERGAASAAAKYADLAWRWEELATLSLPEQRTKLETSIAPLEAAAAEEI